METVRLFSMSVCPPSVQGDPRLTFGSGSSLGTRDNREGDRADSTGPPAFQSQQGVLLLRPPPRRRIYVPVFSVVEQPHLTIAEAFSGRRVTRNNQTKKRY